MYFQEFKSRSPLYLKVKSWPITDLKKFIDSHRKGCNPSPLPRSQIQSFLFQLCKGVAHCHDHDVLHSLIVINTRRSKKDSQMEQGKDEGGYRGLRWWHGRILTVTAIDSVWWFSCGHRSSTVQVPFQVPLEVNVILIGFSGDRGYRYTLDTQKLQEFLQVGFPTHRTSCVEIGKPLDIEHHMVFNAILVSSFYIVSFRENPQSQSTLVYLDNVSSFAFHSDCK
ncbi:unnamed protein product [Lactuca saligna]|uniref:DUF7906 domain-containing protein n=1 Tax=Lactuca saligna TaxID=75948 RepID=A0AA36DXP7_LACSI|nr:unnamed protein product [Lactuca saligna]